MPLPTYVTFGYVQDTTTVYELGNPVPYYVAGRAVPVNHPTTGPTDEIDPELVLGVMQHEVDAEPMDGLQPVDLQRVAVTSINDYTRTRLREDGFYRRTLPPLALNNDPIPQQDLRPVRERAAEQQARKRVEENMRKLTLEREAQEQATIKPVTKKRKLIRD